MKNQQSIFSRRKFLGAGMLGAAGLSFLPGLTIAGQDNPLRKEDIHQIRLGFIGVGRQAMGILNGMMRIPGVEVLACADVYEIKRERFKFRVDRIANELGKTNGKVEAYANYKDLLARTDIDAVVIASPDHWHALMAIDACHAGKDVYLEKPLTLTIKEGQELVKAVRSTGAVLAVGTQQRSDLNFQHAARMALRGKIGKVQKVLVHVGQPEHPKAYDLEEQSIPSGLDWQAWLGPLPAMHFNEELNPPISLDPEENEKLWGAWRWFKETGGGYMTDWGAHMFDIAQWGLGMDRSGPVKVIPGTDSNPLTYHYANGVEMIVGPFDEGRQGVKFIGDKGWIKVSRGQFDASDESLKPTMERPNLGYPAHHWDFIDSVLKRKDPIVPVEVGHSTCVICTIGNIAHELGRPLDWDPVNETFPNDWEAKSRLHYNYENGYTLKIH
ncbi:Gfo/Idh/MocA family protein [Cecembia lonarensis]|uniref:Inositol 2-dehydrogenase n=1 Tax=Cecembia lonarensis (strain CCUG 58316 / KCTC 22772 / LW9) TaxID=1225176 RepID=K1L438_CECL9|nr:Gfo/Idh/MocA family oxidoreductase [Cecembia lonarensis]EKB49581.1 Inositol 2-dehydrogenase [Cecembia lonarensis LW9]